MKKKLEECLELWKTNEFVTADQIYKMKKVIKNMAMKSMLKSLSILIMISVVTYFFWFGIMVSLGMFIKYEGEYSHFGPVITLLVTFIAMIPFLIFLKKMLLIGDKDFIVKYGFLSRMDLHNFLKVLNNRGQISIKQKSNIEYFMKHKGK